MIRLLAGLILIPVLAAGTVVYWLCFTEHGTGFILDQIDSRTESISLGAAEGTLAHGIDIANLEITAGNTTAILTDIHLTVDPFALAWLRVRLYELLIDRVEVTVLPGGDGGGELPVIASPVNIVLSRGFIRTLTITAEDTTHIRDVEISGTLSGSNLNVGHFSAVSGTSRVALSLDARLEPPWSITSTYRIDIEEIRGRQVTARGILDGTTEKMDIKGIIRSDQEVHVEGSLMSVARNPSVDLTFFARRLDLEPFVSRELELTDTRLHVAGDLRAYRLDGTGGLTMPGFPAFDVTLTGSGDEEGWTADGEIRQGGNVLLLRADDPNRVEFQLDAPDPGDIYPGVSGDLEATGFLTFNDGDDGVTLESRISARRIPLSLIEPRIEGEANLDGNMAYTQGRLSLDIPGIRGKLFQHEVTGYARGSGSSLDDAKLAADLDIGGNRIEFSGNRISGELELRVDAPDLAAFHPEIHGDLYVDASLRLGPDEFVQIDARSGHLAIGKYRFDDVVIHVPESTDHYTANGRFSSLQYEGSSLGSASVEYDGTVNEGNVHMLWHHPQVDVELATSLLRSNESMQGKLLRASLGLPDGHAWHLDGPTAWSVQWADTIEATITPHCWRRNQSNACFDDLGYDDGLAVIAARLKDIPLSVQELAVNQDVAVSARGMLNVNLDARIKQGMVSSEFSGHVAGAELTWSEEEQPLALDLRLAGQVRDNRLEAEITSTDASDYRIRARLNVPDIMVPKRLIADAGLSGEYGSLLVALIPQATQGTGHVRASGQYDSTSDPPSMAGELNIENAALVIPAAGIRLSEVQMSARAIRQDHVSFNGTATSGNDSIDVEGEIADPLVTDRRIRATIVGRNFLAANRKDLKLVLSPDLIVNRAEGKLQITGNIGIESGEIRLKQFDSGLRARSPDVRVTGVQETGTPLSRAELNLTIHVRDAVRITAFGLDTHIAGELSINQGPSTPARALGTLTLSRGTFERYGHKLNIDRGRLIYSGPLNNPIVDVVTSRTVTRRNETVRVVLSLSGPANNVQSQITSTPPMSDANALSWLLLGRPLSTASGTEGQELAGAAVAFGLRRALPVTREIADTLGLDELSISAETLDTTAILAGKQVSHDLYLQYNYDIFSRIGGILLNYSLTPHVSIEAQSGKAKSLELIYSF